MRALRTVVTVICAAVSCIVSAKPVDIGLTPPPVQLRVVPGETVDGFPKFFVTEGRIVKTMVSNGKLIGFENADGTQTRFSHVLLPNSGGRISHLVFSGANGDANAVVKVFRSGGIDRELEEHARYTVEDPRSIEQIQSEIKSQQTRRDTFYSSVLDSAKDAAALSGLSAERRKSGQVCEITCDRDSEFTNNRCDRDAELGESSCSLLNEGGISGAIAALNCREKFINRRNRCKDNSAAVRYLCRLKCSDPFQYNPQ